MKTAALGVAGQPDINVFNIVLSMYTYRLREFLV